MGAESTTQRPSLARRANKPEAPPYINRMKETHDLPAYLAVAVEAARAGAAVLESWRGKFHVREKARADLVSEADVAAQLAIRDVLLARFPGHGFLGEEDSVGKAVEETRPPPGSPPTWVVDPLDGTVNYVHDVPCYCVSIGLVIDGVPEVGVIYEPRLGELFTAATGHGAHLNGRPMRVSGCRQLSDGLVSTGFPAAFEAQTRAFDAWQKLSRHAQALRRTGSTAVNLAYVACGRFDGYWAYDNYPWDVAAGVVLVREAGGDGHRRPRRQLRRVPHGRDRHQQPHPRRAGRGAGRLTPLEAGRAGVVCSTLGGNIMSAKVAEVMTLAEALTAGERREVVELIELGLDDNGEAEHVVPVLSDDLRAELRRRGGRSRRRPQPRPDLGAGRGVRAARPMSLPVAYAAESRDDIDAAYTTTNLA